jgi:manganese/iron transport system ATP-binding protein
MTDYALELQDVSVAYDGRPALEGVSIAVERGTMLGVLGPNGGGKSTLLKAILGISPVRGVVRVFGGHLDRRTRRRVGYVPQREPADLDFPVSALDVVMMGRVPSLGLFHRASGKDRDLAREALEMVGMSEAARTPIGELSGGQQQRVFLARALAQEPEVLLLDEPVSGVDVPSRAVIFGLLRRLRDEGKTIVLTSHDLSSAAETFDAVLLLGCRAVAFGDPAEVLTPEALREAYGERLSVLEIGGRALAVEDTRHEEDAR